MPNVYELLPEHRALVDDLVKRYGSLGAARDAAGVARGRPAETRETVIASLRHLARLDVRLTPKVLRRLGEDSLIKGCYAFFGSVPAARDAAGLTAPTRSTRAVLPKEEVLARLRHLAGPERKLLARDVRDTLGLDAIHHFGSKIAAIDAAGLVRPMPNQRWTRESVLDAVAERRARGQEVSWGALAREGRYDLSMAIQRHMGGMPGSKRAAPAVRRRRQTRARPVVGREAAFHREVSALVRRLVSQLLQVATDVARAELGQPPRGGRARRGGASTSRGPRRAPRKQRP